MRIKKSKNANTIFGLPAKSYIDENFWKKECETVLSNGWLFVGFAHELKNPGDVNPIFVANKPILLVEIEEKHTKKPIETTINFIKEFGYECYQFNGHDIIKFDKKKHNILDNNFFFKGI